MSTDSGRTWNKTGGSLYFPTQPSAVALPDGGLAFTYRAHSWQSPGVAISYDEGRSFNYMLTGPYETAGAFVMSDDEFLVYVTKSNRSGISSGSGIPNVTSSSRSFRFARTILWATVVFSLRKARAISDTPKPPTVLRVKAKRPSGRMEGWQQANIILS